MATQLFQWAQDHQTPIEQEAADVVDVSDRLAWVLFKQGEIEQSKRAMNRKSRIFWSSGADEFILLLLFYKTAYAAKVEQARAAFKDVRNFESKLGPQVGRGSVEKSFSSDADTGRPCSAMPDLSSGSAFRR